MVVGIIKQLMLRVTKHKITFSVFIASLIGAMIVSTYMRNEKGDASIKVLLIQELKRHVDTLSSN